MTIKTKKLNNILESLYDYYERCVIHRYGHELHFIAHGSLQVLISEHVGYNDMPHRTTISLWVNKLLHYGFIRKYGKYQRTRVSYEQKEYRIVKSEIVKWLDNFKAEVRAYEAIQKQKPDTPLSLKQPVLTDFCNLVIDSRGNNDKRQLRRDKVNNL